MGDVTQILSAIGSGDAKAADRLLEAVYGELQRLAAIKLAQEKPGHTLQATALVHDAYLRLLGDGSADFENRAHFFGAAAEAMRRILIESARRKARLKHGGGLQRVEFEAQRIVPSQSIDLLALDEALEKLAAEDPAKAELVKLRFFAGLGVEASAQVLGISKATADRHWAYARAWLYDEVAKGDEPA